MHIWKSNICADLLEYVRNRLQFLTAVPKQKCTNFVHEDKAYLVQHRVWILLRYAVHLLSLAHRW